MTAKKPLPEIVRSVAEEALELASLLDRAQGVQWSPAPIPRPRVDTTERSRGGHGDPTADIALDDRRLAVRAAVVSAEVALEKAVREMTAAQSAVRRSLARYYGDLA